jgi:hypothetical protein
MKPLFTIHAGEFLVGGEIEHKCPNVNVWVPAKDIGVALLVTDASNERAISLQVKFSRDYVVATHTTHMQDEFSHTKLRASGWWTVTRQQIKKSPAKYWVFVLAGFVNRTTDCIIIEPRELLKRLDGIHQGKPDKFQCYFSVTNGKRCWDIRGLKKQALRLVAEGTSKEEAREFTTHLNNWRPIEALNG